MSFHTGVKVVKETWCTWIKNINKQQINIPLEAYSA